MCMLLCSKRNMQRRCALHGSDGSRNLPSPCVLYPSPAAPQLLAEIKIHRSLSHPFVVGFDSFFEDRANVYIMLELCPHQVSSA